MVAAIAYSIYELMLACDRRDAVAGHDRVPLDVERGVARFAADWTTRGTSTCAGYNFRHEIDVECGQLDLPRRDAAL